MERYNQFWTGIGEKTTTHPMANKTTCGECQTNQQLVEKESSFLKPFKFHGDHVYVKQDSNSNKGFYSTVPWDFSRQDGIWKFMIFGKYAILTKHMPAFIDPKYYH